MRYIISLELSLSGVQSDTACACVCVNLSLFTVSVVSYMREILFSIIIGLFLDLFLACASFTGFCYILLSLKPQSDAQLE